MSGIEIVGVVLGAWPVVATVVAGVHALKNGQAIIDHLQHELDVSQTIFTEFIRGLLEGDEQITDDERSTLCEPQTEDDLASVKKRWANDDLKRRLEDRLSTKTVETIIAHVRKVHQLLAQIQSKIQAGGLAPLAEGASRLRAMRRAATSLRHSLHGSDLRTDLERLRLYVTDLMRLYMITSPPPPSRLKASRRPRRRAGSMPSGRSARQYFDQFHETLRGSFHCTCNEAHEANLRVYFDVLEILFAVGEIDERESEIPIGPRRASTFSSQAATPPADTDDPEYLNTSDWYPGAKDASHEAVRGSHPALPVHFTDVVPASRDLGHIPDLCHWVKTQNQTPPNSPNSNPTPWGFLGTGDRKYTAKLPRDTQCPSSIICMDDWMNQPLGCHLSRRHRINLALSLALFVIQLYETSWVGKNWTWRNFSMGKDEMNEDPQLFVTTRIYSADVPSPEKPVPESPFWALLREPVLVRLGFALIELALGKRLSELRALTHKDGTIGTAGAGISVVQDYNTAMMIVEQGILRDEVSDAYQAIVNTCLQCEVINDDGAKSLTKRCSTFQDDLELFVAAPLKEYIDCHWNSV